MNRKVLASLINMATCVAILLASAPSQSTATPLCTDANEGASITLAGIPDGNSAIFLDECSQYSYRACTYTCPQQDYCGGGELPPQCEGILACIAAGDYSPCGQECAFLDCMVVVQ